MKYKIYFEFPQIKEECNTLFEVAYYIAVAVSFYAFIHGETNLKKIFQKLNPIVQIENSNIAYSGNTLYEWVGDILVAEEIKF